MSRWQKPKDDPADGPLWSSPAARATDPETSREAAAAVQGSLGELQRRVLAVYQMAGPMTAKEAEALDCFADLGFSTVRKRCSELVAGGYLVATDERRGRCFVLKARV